MEDRLFTVAKRLRPDLETMRGDDRTIGVVDLLGFLYTLPLKKEKVDLKELVDTIVTKLRMKAKSKGILLRKVMPDKKIVFTGDVERTTQLVQNLVDNSIKYTPKDGRIWVAVLSLPPLSEITPRVAIIASTTTASDRNTAAQRRKSSSRRF